MIKRIKAIIIKSFNILLKPEAEFADLHNRTFESVLNDYVILLAISAIVAGLVAFLYSVGYALYLGIFKQVNIEYWNMANYAAGSSVSLLFFYLFAGTFILFIVSIFLRIFVKKMSYVNLFNVIFYSLTPLLLFSWLRIAVVGLFIWCAFLFIEGVIIHNKAMQVKQDSIQQRD